MISHLESYSSPPLSPNSDGEQVFEQNAQSSLLDYANRSFNTSTSRAGLLDISPKASGYEKNEKLDTIEEMQARGEVEQCSVVPNPIAPMTSTHVSSRDFIPESRSTAILPINIEILNSGLSQTKSRTDGADVSQIASLESRPDTVRRRNSSRHTAPQIPSASNVVPDISSVLQESLEDTKAEQKAGSKASDNASESGISGRRSSAKQSSIPAPLASLPTYLQLELSSRRPSPTLLRRSSVNALPYESSEVKLTRLLNFILLPPQLEQTLWFGALACVDAWLFSFTILPLRFLKAVGILTLSKIDNLDRHAASLQTILFQAMQKLKSKIVYQKVIDYMKSEDHDVPTRSSGGENVDPPPENSRPPSLPKIRTSFRKRSHGQTNLRQSRLRSRRMAASHKADLLQGGLIAISCSILMYLDASRMYHSIRGQAAIKLYVIYNVLEVCDRLFSAIGQDILECLLSEESLERRADGRSKILRPFWLFILALIYNLIHTTALFYQVITLNVAVNSYSNALLTLLMSNQFVEIKSTVFKKFEKENLFQLTCADIVERFQLWLMLLIIASRNIIETGGLGLFLNGPDIKPLFDGRWNGITSQSLAAFINWAGHILAPFFVVLGSEMLVDWLKHAYITKFNNTKPAIYGRFLDILAKDYYTEAFGDQNLMKRLGLPVIPLACLFIRASVQTYHMFIATHMVPSTSATASSLMTDTTTTSAATAEALHRLDDIFHRTIFHTPRVGGYTFSPSQIIDFFLPYLLPLTVFLLIFMILLFMKLCLGIALLTFARARYKDMRNRQNTNVTADGRRLGGWGVVEVDEEKRKWIYADDPDGAQKVRDREAKAKEAASRPNNDDRLSSVERYSMVAKRIW